MLSRRIVIDTVRRMWPVYAFAIAAITFLRWISSRAFADEVSLGSPGDVFAWSMGVCWFLAWMPLIVLDAREIQRLPVSRRDFWVSRWWLGVTVPAGTMAIALIISLPFFGHDLRGERLALCLLYSALYGGCYMGVSAVVPFKAIMGPGRRSIARALILLLGVMLGGAAMPLWFAKYLPHTFAEFGGPMQSVIVAAVGITIASYFYHPPVEPRAGRPQWKKAAPNLHAPSTVGDGLTGLSFLYWKEGRRTAMLLAIVVVLGLGYWRIVEPGTSAVQFLHGAWALPFANVPAAPHGNFPLGLVLLISLMASDFDLIGDVRRLRSLPLSTSRLAAVLTSAGVLFAGVFWVGMLALHAVFVGSWPATLRPDLFFVLAGGVALSQSVRMVLPVNGFVKAAVGGICTAPAYLAFPFAYTPLDWRGAVMLMTSGALALALSFLINRWSISNSSRIYKFTPVLALFGGAVNDQPR